MQHFLFAQGIFWLSFFVLLIPLFFIYRFWFFFRNPKRKIPAGNNIVSPADGFINYIKEIKNDEVPISVKKGQTIKLNELIGTDKIKYNLVIGIFMTPFSVHHNRIPFDGIVTKNYYKTPGNNKSMLKAFLNLIYNIKPYTDGANYILDNERSTIKIKNELIEGAVVQIADKWVHKIVNKPLKIGDKVNKGELFGLIRMGSQCDLFLNIKKRYRIVVKEREYVKGGSSILLELEK